MRHAWFFAAILLMGAGLAKLTTGTLGPYLSEQFQLPLVMAGFLATALGVLEVVTGIGLLYARTRYVSRGIAFGLGIGFVLFHAFARMYGDLIPACPCLGFRVTSDGAVAHSVGLALSAFLAASVIPVGWASMKRQTPLTGVTQCVRT